MNGKFIIYTAPRIKRILLKLSFSVRLAEPTESRFSSSSQIKNSLTKIKLFFIQRGWDCIGLLLHTTQSFTIILLTQNSRSLCSVLLRRSAYASAYAKSSEPTKSVFSSSSKIKDRLTNVGLSFIQRGWDSNPRYSCPYTTLPRLHHQPLGHPSSMVYNIIYNTKSVVKNVFIFYGFVLSNLTLFLHKIS